MNLSSELCEFQLRSTNLLEVIELWPSSDFNQYFGNQSQTPKKMGKFGGQNAHSTLNTDGESGV